MSGMGGDDQFEAQDIPGWRMLTIGAATLMAIIIAVAWSWDLDGSGSRQLVSPPAAIESAAIEPGLIAGDAAAPLLQAQRSALARFSWVDRSHGVVAIPIEQAMRLYASRQP